MREKRNSRILKYYATGNMQCVHLYSIAISAHTNNFNEEAYTWPTCLKALNNSNEWNVWTFECSTWEATGM